MHISGTATSNTTLAMQQLRDLIFSGQLEAGTDHLEGELAARLGMSRTPVREALLQLEGQGLLVVRPRKGVRITPLSPRDLAEVYDILTELESLAIANAISRGLDDDALGPLLDAIEKMEAAITENSPEEWASADATFHSELVRLGRNERVQKIIQMMTDQVRRARVMTLPLRPPPPKLSSEHRKVVDAIRAGDVDQARRIHRTHRVAAKTMLMDLLERHHLNYI